MERITPFVEPWARVTRRLYQIVQILGLATSGRLRIRVTDRLGIQTTRHTILRRIMALPTEPIGQVSQIGIDDFSFRRGRKFGTIVVDLQTHKMLDVLPDRTADTSAAWMLLHPEIEIVSEIEEENMQPLQMEDEVCRIRKRYLPFLTSYCEKSSFPDYWT